MDLEPERLLAALRKLRIGHVIVNIIGTGGKVASAMHLPGGTANAALMLVSAGPANAWGSHGIRVNAINPGATYTDRVKNSLETEARLIGKPEEELLKASQTYLKFSGAPAAVRSDWRRQ